MTGVDRGPPGVWEGMTTKRAKKEKPEDRVSRLYGRACHGVQIPIMAMGGVMRLGVAAIREGKDDDQVSAVLREAAEAIRVN